MRIMELNDVIYLSLFYMKKKGLRNFTSEEVISVGYQAFLQTEKLFDSGNGAKKTTYFMQILEWHFREEFRKASPVKIPKWAWNKGKRAGTTDFDICKYDYSNKDAFNCCFDDFDTLYKSFEKLSEKQKYIVAHKYGLFGREKLPFLKIAKKINLSPQRVRVIHLNALKLLRNEMEMKLCG